MNAENYAKLEVGDRVWWWNPATDEISETAVFSVERLGGSSVVLVHVKGIDENSETQFCDVGYIHNTELEAALFAVRMLADKINSQKEYIEILSSRRDRIGNQYHIGGD